MSKKILVVEDEAPMRSALCDKLVREGFITLEAKNGKEGLEIALKEHPDLILLDIVMPIMDGMAMLKKLREDQWGKSAYVIMLTNLSDSQKLSEAFTQGSFEYLVKSDWKIEAVIAKIRERLGLSVGGES